MPSTGLLHRARLTGTGNGIAPEGMAERLRATVRPARHPCPCSDAIPTTRLDLDPRALFPTSPDRWPVQRIPT
ncbi:hypothetical protein GCM10023088_57180 [Actinomadura verrucosospora]